MNRLFKLSLFTSLAFLLSVSAYSQDTPFSNVITDDARYLDDFEPIWYVGGVIGIVTPYGWGLELSYQFNEQWDVNAGLGIGFSGYKRGLGVRYYLRKSARFTPFLGANITANSGLADIEIVSGSTTAVYNIRPDITLYTRGGLAWLFPQYTWFINFGYGTPFFHQEAQFVSGVNTMDGQSIANFFLPRGLELSIGVRKSF